MSYTFNNTGGTNHGIKTYNQIFAMNRTTAGASNYWNPTLVSGDTVLCKIQYIHNSNAISNYKLLTWYDFDQGGSFVYGAHWIGTGIYLCYCNDTSGWDIGEFVCQPLLTSEPSPSPGARPIVEKASNTDEAQTPMGVALEPADEDGSFATVALSGAWPIKRSVTLTRQQAIYSTINSSGEITNVPPPVTGTQYKAGAMGKAIDIDYDIITSTAATPTTANGALICVWGTAAESY